MNSIPSISGMRISSSNRSKRSFRTISRPFLGSVAPLTSVKPPRFNRPVTISTLVAISSTTRIGAVRMECSRKSSVTRTLRQHALHRRQELADINRLGEIMREAGAPAALDIGRHGGSGQRHHRGAGGGRQLFEL